MTCLLFAQYLFIICSQFVHNSFTIFFYNLFKTCSQLVHNFFTTCLWLAHILLTTFSQFFLVQYLFSRAIYFFMTCSQFVHNLLMIWSQLVHDLFDNCSPHLQRFKFTQNNKLDRRAGLSLAQLRPSFLFLL